MVVAVVVAEAAAGMEEAVLAGNATLLMLVAMVAWVAAGACVVMPHDVLRSGCCMLRAVPQGPWG